MSAEAQNYNSKLLNDGKLLLFMTSSKETIEHFVKNILVEKEEAMRIDCKKNLLEKLKRALDCLYHILLNEKDMRIFLIKKYHNRIHEKDKDLEKA